MRGGRPEYGLLDALLDDDGTPPCTPPDACTVCRLFDDQRPGETRSAWLARITGHTHTEEIAS